MNEQTGRIVQDSSTANPPSYNTWKAADRDTLIKAVVMSDEANQMLKGENITLRADIAKLEAENAELSHLRNKIAILESENTRLFEENAELREKCMTRFARIKNAANADDMAQMLHKLYMTGYGDALYYKETGKDDATFNNVFDLSHYLQEIGTI